MNELLPVVLGFCFGNLTGIVSGRRRRAAFAAGIMGCIALSAFLASGEFRESWAYGLLDLLEVAIGFEAGSIVAWRYGMSRSSARR
jgi:hypothetical protein